jgi:hypothetical protein
MRCTILSLLCGLVLAGCAPRSETDPEVSVGKARWREIANTFRGYGTVKKCEQRDATVGPWSLGDVLATCKYLATTFDRRHGRTHAGRARTRTKLHLYASPLYQNYFFSKANPRWTGRINCWDGPPCVVSDEVFGRLLQDIGDPKECWAWRFFLLLRINDYVEWQLTDKQTLAFADAVEGILSRAEAEDPWVLNQAPGEALSAVRRAYVRAATNDQRVAELVSPKMKGLQRTEVVWGSFLAEVPDSAISPDALRSMKNWRVRAARIIEAYARTDSVVRDRIKGCWFFSPPRDWARFLIQQHASIRLVDKRLEKKLDAEPEQ